MKKIALKIFLTLFLITAFSFSIVSSKANAALVTTDVLFCSNNSGTYWGVTATYTSIYGSTYSLPSGTYADQTGSTCGTYYAGLYIDGYAARDGDQVTWHTACVDPTQTIYPTYYNYQRQGEQYYEAKINITCSSNSIGGHPASCDTPNGWGYISASSWCPSGPYCMKGGLVYSQSASYCPGAFAQTQTKGTVPSSCNDYTYVCHHTYCNSNLTCSGLQVDNGTQDCRTSGCQCAYTSVPADAGSLSATSSCIDGSPGKANMRFSWADAARATSYTLHYYTGGAWHTASTTGNALTETVDDNYSVSWYIVTSNCYGSNTGPTQHTTSATCLAPVLHAAANPAVGSATGPTAAKVQSVNHTIGNCNTFAGNLIFGLPATCTGSSLGSTDTYIKPYSVSPSSCTFTGFTCKVNKGNGILNCANPSYVNINLQVNDDATLTANYNCTYDITTNVYLDNNGNGVRDASEPLYGSPTTITYSGTLAGSKSITGTGIIANVPPGNETVVLTVPSGFTATTPSTRTVSGGPDQTINFGIQPPTPTCTGITAQSPIYQRATSQVTSSGCKSYSGQAIDYKWSVPVVAGRGDSISGSSYTTATYTAGPDARQNGYETLPNLQVCNPGLTAGEKTTLCNNYATKIDVLPLYTISGYVYVDTNKDRIKQAGESNTAATVTVTAKNSSGATVGTASVPTGTGAYTIAGAGGIPSLPAGQYTVSITSPAGYIPTTATSLTVNVGTSAGVGPGGIALTACSPLGAGSLPDPAACDAKGDITNLNFGISNSIPWVQSGPENPTGPTNGGSGDTNMPNGWNNFVPAGTCGTVPHYVSLNGPTVGGGATPGIISVGSGSFNFCPGGAPTAGGCQNSASSTQWVAGGLPSDYPSSFSSVNPGIIRTSYNYLLSIVKQAGITPVAVNATMFTGTLAHGVYQSSGDLTLGNATGGTYTFPAGDYVILVNGNLYLKENIKVAHGSTVLFSVSGSIYVDPTVGESTYTSYATDIEGFYSADKDFVIQGGNGNNCPTGDKRVNIGGSVVVNASLNGGTFSNQRDLCGNDLSCPTVYVAGRPDFLLNAPQLYMNTRRVWQEIAPNQ